jgi:glycogen synthase kinase 3 beta
LRYVPEERCKAIEACAHPFFNPIRNPSQKLPDGSDLPIELFTFTPEEWSLAKESVQAQLIPPHVRATVSPPGPPVPTPASAMDL